MLFDSEPIDSRPTADDFPHRIWAEEEIPEAYRPFLTADRPFENMIFSPKPPYARDAREYLLSWTENDLLYLEKQRGQSIRSVQIVQEQVCAVLVSEDLLKGEWQTAGLCFKIHFSCQRWYRARDLCLPLRRLLGLSLPFCLLQGKR